jgi:hypothetical protein
MRSAWTREEMEARVDELHRAHTGAEFADAVRRFSTDELGPDDRPLLHDVLLDRAAVHERNLALERRFEAGGWFRRTTKRLDDALDPLRRSTHR